MCVERLRTYLYVELGKVVNNTLYVKIKLTIILMMMISREKNNFYPTYENSEFFAAFPLLRIPVWLWLCNICFWFAYKTRAYSTTFVA